MPSRHHASPVNPSGGGAYGRYDLVEQIGQGGMAEVWKARLRGPHQFARTMVVKRILPHLCKDREFVRMFVAEAKLSAYLSHPNIVPVFDFGDVDGSFYLAMELVKGVDLLVARQRIRPQLPLGLTAFVAHEVCVALAHAYNARDEQGAALQIVHRDVSPSNIMLSYDGGVRLLDFGIAKALGRTEERTQTDAGVVKGKFAYMAPEHIEGQPFDHRCDVFAVGVVLHELLTGKRLFKADNDLHTLTQVRTLKIPTPSEIEPRVPESLDRITMKALARDPLQRFQTAEEMARELDGALRELGWGRHETAQLLRDHFPFDQQESSGSSRPPAPYAPSPASPDQLPSLADYTVDVERAPEASQPGTRALGGRTSATEVRLRRRIVTVILVSALAIGVLLPLMLRLPPVHEPTRAPVAADQSSLPSPPAVSAQLPKPEAAAAASAVAAPAPARAAPAHVPARSVVAAKPARHIDTRARARIRSTDISAGKIVESF